MNNLKFLREKANLTQDELSKLSGIPKGTIRDWEQKGYPKQIIQLIILKNKLNCTYEELLTNRKDSE